MPTYEYACSHCGHQFETFQRMSDDPLKQCPECKKPALQRLISAGAGIIFKGSGFYETDYKSPKSDPKGKEATTSDSGGGSDKKEKAATGADSSSKSGSAAQKKSGGGSD